MMQCKCGAIREITSNRPCSLCGRQMEVVSTCPPVRPSKNTVSPEVRQREARSRAKMGILHRDREGRKTYYLVTAARKVAVSQEEFFTWQDRHTRSLRVDHLKRAGVEEILYTRMTRTPASLEREM